MTHIIAVANRVLVKCLLATVVVWGYLTDLAALVGFFCCVENICRNFFAALFILLIFASVNHLI
jgi:hypothetical protein